MIVSSTVFSYPIYMSNVQVMESVAVPQAVRQNLIRKVTNGEISRKRLAHSIGISEPTFYKIIGKKGARVSVKTMELLHKFKKEEKEDEQPKGDETPKQDAPTGFAKDSVMGKHFNRRETAEKVLNALDTVLSSDMDDASKLFAAERLIGKDNK